MKRFCLSGLVGLIVLLGALTIPAIASAHDCPDPPTWGYSVSQPQVNGLAMWGTGTMKCPGPGTGTLSVKLQWQAPNGSWPDVSGSLVSKTFTLDGTTKSLTSVHPDPGCTSGVVYRTAARMTHHVTQPWATAGNTVCP